MKKVFASLLALCMVFALCACGSSPAPAAKAPVSLTMGTGGEAGTYYAFGGVVGGYKAIESGVVGGYKKIEDAFVGKFLTKEGESVEDAKKRLGGRA